MFVKLGVMIQSRLFGLRSQIVSSVRGGTPVSGTMAQRYVHRLAPKPHMKHKIPQKNLKGGDSFIRRMKHGRLQDVPIKESALYARWGGWDLSRWPRESEEERKLTQQEIQATDDIDGLYYVLYKRKNTIHFLEIVDVIEKILRIARENVSKVVFFKPLFLLCENYVYYLRYSIHSLSTLYNSNI